MSVIGNVSILSTDNGDGSGEFTLSFADDDHKFSASVEGDEAVVQYEETLSWRGKTHTSEPSEQIFKELMTSDEMTEFLEAYDCDSVRQ